MTQTVCAYRPYVMEIHARTMHLSTQMKWLTFNKTGYFHAYCAPASGQITLRGAILSAQTLICTAIRAYGSYAHSVKHFFLQKQHFSVYPASPCCPFKLDQWFDWLAPAISMHQTMSDLVPSLSFHLSDIDGGHG